MTPHTKAAMEQALEQLESVLCDPAGNVCWHGSYADRDIIGDALDVFRAALVEPAQEPVAGWKLVPVLPTIKMRTAGSEAATPALYSPMVVYAAMLNAAPQPPAPAVECQGIPRPGCNYLAKCGSVCNKCGQVHKAAPPIPAPAVEDDLTIAYMAGYHAAKKAPAVELTDEEIKKIKAKPECWEHVGQNIEFRYLPFARAAIAAHEAKKVGGV